MKIHLKLVQQDKMNEALERDGLKKLHVNFTKAKRISIKVESLFSMSLFLSLSFDVIFSLEIRFIFIFFLSRSLTMSFSSILSYSILTLSILFKRTHSKFFVVT